MCLGLVLSMSAGLGTSASMPASILAAPNPSGAWRRCFRQSTPSVYRGEECHLNSHPCMTSSTVIGYLRKEGLLSNQSTLQAVPHSSPA